MYQEDFHIPPTLRWHSLGLRKAEPRRYSKARYSCPYLRDGLQNAMDFGWRAIGEEKKIQEDDGQLYSPAWIIARLAIF